jgi:hypothetical protein
MLGAAEFTMAGNILIGMMAILGVCALLYAVGSSMSNARPGDWIRANEEMLTGKKAA